MKVPSSWCAYIQGRVWRALCHPFAYDSESEWWSGLECIRVHSKARGPGPTGQKDGGCTHCPPEGEGGVSERLMLCRETTWSRAGCGDQRRGHQTGIK